MRRPMHHTGKISLELKMTAMIDVVFQLLIFFVCTVNFESLEKILPTSLTAIGSSGAVAAPTPEIAELEDVVVKLSLAGPAERQRVQWSINNQPYGSFTQVGTALRQLAKIRADLPVILDAQPDVAIGDVIDVYDLCNMAGFEQVQFAAKAGTL